MPPKSATHPNAIGISSVAICEPLQHIGILGHQTCTEKTKASPLKPPFRFTLSARKRSAQSRIDNQRQHASDHCSHKLRPREHH